MTILVTGGAGFIGSNLCENLLKNGHRVIAVDNFITGNRLNLKVLQKYPNFQFIQHDITHPLVSINRQLSTLDQIYHLACPTGVDNLIPLAQEMLLTNSAGTKNVLDLALTSGAKLVFTSSSEIYGDPQVSPQQEKYTGNVDPTGIRSPYEEGKRLSESMVSMYVRKYGLDAKIVRIFNTYGPFMSQKDNRAIPLFLRKALNNEPLPVHGEGKQTRTFCYVDDLIIGLILVADKGKTGDVYNLGSDEQITIYNLACKVIEFANSKSEIKFVERPKHDHQGRKPDLSKIKKFGWWPKISLREGIIRTIQSQNQ